MRSGWFFTCAEVPDTVLPAFRLGRMTALKKPSGGIHGIVVSDVVGGTHIGTALSTRAGCECVAHALQSMSELDESATTSLWTVWGPLISFPGTQ